MLLLLLLAIFAVSSDDMIKPLLSKAESLVALVTLPCVANVNEDTAVMEAVAVLGGTAAVPVSASAPTGNSYLVTNNQLATIATRETLVPRPQ